MQEENKKKTCQDKTCNHSDCNCNQECSSEEETGTTGTTKTEEKNPKKQKQEKKDKHKKKIEELENKIKELEEKALRDKAEMINYRRRKEEENTRILKYCNEDLIKQLLPVIDNFERAIKMDDDNLEDEVSKFLAGFKMIYSNLALTLQNFEVKAIDGANKPFDPVYHDGVMTEKRDDMEPGMVIEVLQKGYMLKDKVIRPAMVKVSE